MKVADENGGGFDHGLEKVPHRLPALQGEHDTRGLVLAILLCMVCWAALGYFLLK